MIRWIKLCGFAAFVGILLVWGPSFGQLLAVFGDLNLWWWALAVAMYAIALWLSAIRLHDLVTANNVTVRLRRLFGDIIRASALNTFLLYGTGEAYKAARIRSLSGATVSSIALVLFDRVIGLAMQLGILLLAIALVPLPKLNAAVAQLPWLGILLVCALVCVLVVAAALRLRGLIRQTLPFVSQLLGSPIILLRVTGVSLLVVVALVVSVWALVQGAGLAISVQQLWVAVPFVTIASLLPITIGGLGVRETGYAVLLQSSVVSQADCIALGLMQYSVFVCVAIIGVFLLGFQLQPESLQNNEHEQH